jgi:hypothetical protein
MGKLLHPGRRLTKPIKPKRKSSECEDRPDKDFNKASFLHLYNVSQPDQEDYSKLSLVGFHFTAMASTAPLIALIFSSMRPMVTA